MLAGIGGVRPVTTATAPSRLPRLFHSEGFPAAEAEFYDELAPSRTVAIRYSEEPGLFHERLLLWPSRRARGQGTAPHAWRAGPW